MQNQGFKDCSNCTRCEQSVVEGDHMEVIGNGVDSVCLTRALRKKLGFANIIKVEQVGESTATTEEENPTPIQYCTTTSSYSHFQHPPIVCPMYYHEPTDNCSIM
ncbi:hypothetical protein RchiOBHm_Chr5g0075331 [Rosa chinensis]|uniref:Uncharacterized protein n=1 Tax=Rosa chinensis TaxID=74649 RepID=A0A2P6QLE7_ROSCH|nr:hypothetical protein RchiOBHm_Chr5g0075331 [Rosa chinensis]